jgi:hypothetical protein
VWAMIYAAALILVLRDKINSPKPYRPKPLRRRGRVWLVVWIPLRRSVSSSGQSFTAPSFFGGGLFGLPEPPAGGLTIRILAHPYRATRSSIGGLPRTASAAGGLVMGYHSAAFQA